MTKIICGQCALSYNGYCRLRKKDIAYFDEGCEDYKEPQGSLMETTNTAPATKVCKTCGRELTLDHFGGHHRTADHLQASCKECMNKKIKTATEKRWKERKAEALGKVKKINATPKTELDEILDKAEPMPIQEPRVKYEAPRELDDYTPQELYDELKRRGWSGTLTRTETLN